MKKFLALVLALVMALSLVACGNKDNADANKDGDGDATATGSVYYLNFKPESDAAWQTLAAAYTAETGVPVKVVTAASGNYDATLTAEMDKDAAPTMFQVGNVGAVNSYGEFCYNLEGTDVYNQMTTHDFDLKNADGETVSIGYCYEAFGIIVNKALLEKAGHSLDEITNFESLKAVADDIHARAAELGFDAFSAPGLDGSSSWRFSGHLANMPLFYEFRDDNVTEQPATIKGTYMDNFRNIWDLYVTDTAADPKTLTTGTADESKAQFTEGKAAFYQNGTWEFAGLKDAGLTDICMIPIYCGVAGEEKAGLCSGTENCWAVNSKVSEADQKASLDFLYWLVTDPTAAQKMVDTLGALPFKSCPESANTFLANGNDLLAKGNYNVSWAFNHTPNVDSWRATVVTALAKYAADRTDANWAEVVKAFVDGWAYEYSVVNG